MIIIFKISIRKLITRFYVQGTMSAHNFIRVKSFLVIHMGERRGKNIKQKEYKRRRERVREQERGKQSLVGWWWWW